MSDELAKCSGSILIDHLKNEVGARCGSLTANAVTLNFCLDVVAGRTEPTKDEYENDKKLNLKLFIIKMIWLRLCQRATTTLDHQNAFFNHFNDFDDIKAKIGAQQNDISN